ncbi:MAG: C69 family dipeptidase, partial [Calditrichaceae bacterium]
YEKDVINLARGKGWFNGKDEDFSFADTYAPPDYGALRFCEARVWSMFRRAAPSLNLSIDYVKGVKDAEPLPLWIKPDKKLTVRDVMELMRDHFEGTDFDMTKDIGAGPHQLPYRWSPLVWEIDSVEYCHERPISTQQTGFSFIAQARSWLPDPIGGILWFGVDDTYSTVYIPVYCNVNKIPVNYAVGVANFTTSSWESAFWVFNFVANYAYLRYSHMIKDIQKVQRELEGRFFADQPGIEEAAQHLYKQSPQLAVDYLTEYSLKAGSESVERWKKLGESLLCKYMDGNMKDEHGNVTRPGYPEFWYRKIIEETGDHYKMQELEPDSAR